MSVLSQKSIFEKYLFPLLLGLISISAIQSSKLNVALIILYIVILVYWCTKNKFRLATLSFFNNHLLIWCSLIFLWHFIGLIYTKDLVMGLKVIESRASILLWPVLLLLFSFQRKSVNIVLRVFILFTGVICIVSHLDTIIRFYNTTEHHSDMILFYFSKWYTHNGLVQYVGFEPQYFGYYLVLSNVFIVYLLRQHTKINWVFLMLLVYQSIFIFQLSSRNAIITNFIVLLFSLFYSGIKLRAKIGLATFIIATLIAIGSLMRGPSSRFISRFQQIGELKETRLTRWGSSLRLAQKHLILGVGTGDATYELTKQYQIEGLNYSAEENYNTHNQFLDFLVKFGVIGFAIFLLFMGYLFKIAISRKDFLFIGVLIVIGMAFMTENIFSRQMGIVPTMIFISLIYNSYPVRGVQ